MYPDLEIDKFRDVLVPLEEFFFEYSRIANSKGDYSKELINGKSLIDELFNKFDSVVTPFHQEMQEYLTQKHKAIG